MVRTRRKEEKVDEVNWLQSFENETFVSRVYV